MTQQPQSDATHAFAELGRIDLATTAVQDVLTRVAELAKETIPGADEVSVTLLQNGEGATAAFTGELALNLDERQYDYGYGPCLDAAEDAVTLVIDDMATEDRWEPYTSQAAEHGAQSSVSVGLPVQQAVTGALNIYGRKPKAFDEESVTLARTFACYAAVALSNAQLYATTAQLAKQMEEAMESRAIIEQAKGVIAGQQACTPDEAFRLLSQHSQNHNRKLRDIAAEIVSQAAASRQDRRRTLRP